MPTTPRRGGWARWPRLVVVAFAIAAAACSGSVSVLPSGEAADAAAGPTAGPSTGADATPGAENDPPGADELDGAQDGAGPGPTTDSPADPPSVSAPDATPTPGPERFVPGGPVGSAAAHDALIGDLAGLVPARLRGSVPWPDLRAADPVAAQADIFEYWLWMAANHPDPSLVEAIAAPGSPSRAAIVTVFAEIDNANELHSRDGAPYRAYDHRIVTLETAGLPMWLTHDVPDDAVVVYYVDESGPTTIRDRNEQTVIGTLPGVPPRQWLSIMVPTEVGWLLWRDELIEPAGELEVPDFAPPGDTETDRNLDV